MFHVVIVNFLFVCNLFNMFDKISMYRILLNLIKMVKYIITLFIIQNNLF